MPLLAFCVAPVLLLSSLADEEAVWPSFESASDGIPARHSVAVELPISPSVVPSRCQINQSLETLWLAVLWRPFHPLARTSCTGLAPPQGSLSCWRTRRGGGPSRLVTASGVWWCHNSSEPTYHRRSSTGPSHTEPENWGPWRPRHTKSLKMRKK